MTKVLILVFTICLAPLTAKADSVARTTAFYAIRPTTTPPTLDGRLDDPCWQQADPATTYYKYWDPHPDLGALKTEFRMVYDDRGIYLLVVNYEKQLDQIRAKSTTRGDPHLWTDDCAEVFFDPEGRGVGYTMFCVNSIGTRQETKRVDAAVVMDEWQGDQWEVVTGKTNDAWTFEAFYPWSDLGRKANSGDLWRFTHVRFAYTSGKFQGVTWAPGANYQSARNLGYLYFADGGEFAPEGVGTLLAKSVAPPWNLPLGTNVLSCDASGTVSMRPAQEVLTRERAAFDEAAARAQEAAGRAGADDLAAAVSHSAKDMPAAPQAANAAEILGAVRSLTAARARVEELYWEGRVRELIHQTTRPVTSSGE